MKDAIHIYFDRDEKRQALRQATIDAWQEYQTTGLYVSADEVIAWLKTKTWGDENEVPPPVCHK